MDSENKKILFVKPKHQDGPMPLGIFLKTGKVTVAVNFYGHYERVNQNNSTEMNPIQYRVLERGMEQMSPETKRKM
jgi:hypothetical protein